MAVDRVTATVADSTEQLQETGTSSYSGEMNAPESSGTYSVKVTAYGSGGNVSEASESLSVSWWRTPKTDWTATDRFNYADYNRIKNNLVYLYETALKLWRPFDIEDMGADITSYAAYWPVEVFNMFERNLETINQVILTQDYGYSQEFFENGPFIKYDELNRIEGAILSMNDILERQKAGLRRLSFRLGTYKRRL